MNTAAACRSYPNDVRPGYDDPSRIEKALEGADEKRLKDDCGPPGTRAVRDVLLKLRNHIPHRGPRLEGYCGRPARGGRFLFRSGKRAAADFARRDAGGFCLQFALALTGR